MKHRACAAVLGCELALVVAASGCRQIVGFDHRKSTSKSGRSGAANLDASTQPSTTACELPYATTDCAACVETHCCSESSACAKDSACLSEARCLANCGSDPQCRAQCGLDGPVSQSTEASTLAACLTSQCEAACGLGCGLSLADYGEVPPEAASGCHDCIVANACEPARACAATEDCDALKRCYPICRTPDCRLACYQAHDAGRSLALSLFSNAGMCDVVCARGGNWSCVGHVSWPKPKSDTTMFTVDFRGPGGPYIGTEVAVCDRLDPDCRNPKAQDKTDASGRVVLEFQNRPSRPSLGLDGFLQLIHPEAAQPLLVVWGFPLSEPEMALADNAEVPGAHAISLGDPKAFEQVTTAFGITVDPSRGQPIAEVVDCMGAPAPGVAVTLEPLDPDVVIIHSFMPGQSATSGSINYAFIFNVPAGVVNVIATPQALGRPSSKQPISVRAGWTSTILMLPTP